MDDIMDLICEPEEGFFVRHDCEALASGFRVDGEVRVVDDDLPDGLDGERAEVRDERMTDSGTGMFVQFRLCLSGSDRCTVFFLSFISQDDIFSSLTHPLAMAPSPDRGSAGRT